MEYFENLAFSSLALGIVRDSGDVNLLDFVIGNLDIS